MLKVALTGGIGTGKSYVRGRFASRGVPTIDSDRLAHEAVASGTAAWQGIVDRFGPDILQPDGEIDRRRLGTVVFADAAARRSLEALVHPAVYERITRWLRDLEEAGRDSVAVADIPLLYETGHAHRFDRVVVVACEPGEQLRRIMTRDGLSEAEARQRVAVQLPIGDKAARADFVILTDGPHADTDRQIDELLERLRAEAGPPTP